MAIETIEDIVEELANLLEVYGGEQVCLNTEGMCTAKDDPRKMCRCCFVANYIGRIRDASAVEAKLQECS